MDGVCGEAHQLERRFKQVEVALRRRARDGGIACDVRLVDEAAQTAAGDTHEPSEVDQVIDRGE